VIVRKRAARIEGWWRKGLTMAQIAEKLGWSTDQLSMEFFRLRKAGHDLPYRRVPVRPVSRPQERQ
jgi:hypothetical protein